MNCSRKCRGVVTPTEPYAGELQQAIFCYERCVFSILGLDLDLPTSGICVQFRISLDFIIRELIKVLLLKTICPQDRRNIVFVLYVILSFCYSVLLSETLTLLITFEQ